MATFSIVIRSYCNALGAAFPKILGGKPTALNVSYMYVLLEIVTQKLISEITK